LPQSDSDHERIPKALHRLEQIVLQTLKKKGKLPVAVLAEESGLDLDQVRRSIEWLREKKYIQVEEQGKEFLILGIRGADALQKKLPERRLLDLLISRGGSVNVEEAATFFEDHSEFSAALGRMIRQRWVSLHTNDQHSSVRLLAAPSKMSEEELIESIGKGDLEPSQLDRDQLVIFTALSKRRGMVEVKRETKRIVSLSPEGMDALSVPLESGLIDQLTPEILTSKEWKGRHFRALNLTAPAPLAQLGRKHPVTMFIDEVREIFVSMGFEEIVGPLVQPAFWNFDALFIPQDHPAREMQDTFYVRGAQASTYCDPEVMSRVSSVHRDGGGTGSKGWGYDWRAKMGDAAVLRTHTTAVTANYLARFHPEEARVFSIGRVFRNERANYKHLAEFHQIEGITVGEKVTVRDLMGLLKAFYARLGLKKVKFWPTYFPYTEPSFQSVVYYDKLRSWIELCGMGIFRPEVTLPLGVKNPVLAWGGGLERLIMLRYDIDDVRELYRNDLAWLRDASLCPSSRSTINV
jgi:phenylalanyl-tRNA synthetase alpha chain